MLKAVLITFICLTAFPAEAPGGSGSSPDSVPAQLKDAILTSESPDTRVKAVRQLGKSGSEKSRTAREYAAFLLEALKNEENKAVETAVSEALYDIGGEALGEIRRVYKEADDSFRRRLSALFPGLSDSRRKNAGAYVRWILARLDPRLGIQRSGKLSRDGSGYFVSAPGAGKVRLISLSRKFAIPAEYIGKTVTVYGSGSDAGLIFARVYTDTNGGKRKTE